MINELGNRYGNLTIVGREPSGRRGEAKWLCQCGCGLTTIVLGSNLRSGRQKSCGCKKRLPKGDAALNFLVRILKKSAKERGYIWALTREQVGEITQNPCYYCGVEPYHEIKNGYNGYNGGLVYNGLDRLDNDKGYILDNVVACCGQCNYAKRNYSLDEFKEWIQRLYHHWMMK